MNTSESSGKNELINNFKILLTEHAEGIILNELETIYKKKFSKSLLSELVQLMFPDGFESSISIIPEDQKSGTPDMVRLMNQESTGQAENTLLQEIKASGIVSKEFRYVSNPMIHENNGTFSAFVSNIDQRTLLIYVQPEDHIQYMEKLTELLDVYYSHDISEKLLVKNPTTGLICVSKFDGVYHRTSIKEDHPDKYVVQYVDIGLTKELGKNNIQFKHLLNYFAEVPSIAIACSLVGIEFKSNNFHRPPEIYQILNSLYRTNNPFFIEPYCLLNDVLQVKIYDADRHCLNTFLVEKGLAFETPMPPSIDVQHDGNQKETQNQSSTVKSLTKTLNDSHGNGAIQQKVDIKSGDLLDDYMSPETDTVNQQHAAKQTALSDSYNDYDDDTYAAPANSKKPKAQTLIPDSQRKHNAQSNGKKFTEIKQSNSVNQHNGQRVEKPSSFRITINQSMPGVRLFGSALSGLSSNQRLNQRKTLSDRVNPIDQQKKDDHTEWMCSFWSKESIWSSDTHKNALLKYIGRIYKQVTNMYRIFTSLKNDFHNLDELDILYKLIISTKQRYNAQSSLNQWQDTSRINRRLEDLKVIFEFNGNYSSSNHPFTITPNGLQKMIDRQRIKSYFDLGCGDGTITAGIGCYLGLSKENIFGSDIFEIQNKNITFIKVNENQSHIDLPNKRVDLVTSFVAFHHISQIKKTLTELARIIRPGGYLILREHDCKNEHSLLAKYLNFVHAIMMIAGVGEFANMHNHNTDYEYSENTWSEEKSRIIEYTKTIRYKSCLEWQQELEDVGFHHCATLFYGANGSENPQNLFYAVYQMNEN